MWGLGGLEGNWPGEAGRGRATLAAGHKALGEEAKRLQRLKIIHWVPFSTLGVQQGSRIINLPDKIERGADREESARLGPEYSSLRVLHG